MTSRLTTGSGGTGQVRRGGRTPKAEGDALPERGTGGGPADRTGAAAAHRPGDDQAAGGGGAAAPLDVLPHVPGDGDHGVPLERGDARARAADSWAPVPKDDEALRPDGGHRDGRRDRTHRDLMTSHRPLARRGRPGLRSSAGPPQRRCRRRRAGSTTGRRTR